MGDQGCWGRTEINYFAQGMWSAESGESLDTALWTTKTWNSSSYQLSTSEIQDKLFWTEYGYLWHQNWLKWGGKLAGTLETGGMRINENVD
jgi:hypothetical protein